MRMMRSNLQVERAAQQRRCWGSRGAWRRRRGPGPGLWERQRRASRPFELAEAGGRELWRAGTGGLSGNSCSSPLWAVPCSASLVLVATPRAERDHRWVSRGPRVGERLALYEFRHPTAKQRPSIGCTRGAGDVAARGVMRARSRKTRDAADGYGLWGCCRYGDECACQVQGYPFSAFGGGLTLVMGAVQKWRRRGLDTSFHWQHGGWRRNGVLLGLFIACRVRAGALPAASNHGIQPAR